MTGIERGAESRHVPSDLRAELVASVGRRLARLLGALLLLSIPACSDQEGKEGPVAEGGGPYVFRPADHLLPRIREAPTHPLPLPADGFACVEVYVGDSLLGKIAPRDLEDTKWQNSDPTKDLAGKGIPYRAPLNPEAIPNLVELLERVGVRNPSHLKVMAPGYGVELPATLLRNPDYQFHLIYNRRKTIKLIMRKNLKDGPGQADHWMETWLVKDVAWVVVTQ